MVQVVPVACRGLMASRLVGGGKRVRLNRKKTAHLAGKIHQGFQFRPRVWKRLSFWDHHSCDHTDVKRRRLHQNDVRMGLGHDRQGIG